MEHLINLAGFLLAYIAVSVPVALGIAAFMRAGNRRRTTD